MKFFTLVSSFFVIVYECQASQSLFGSVFSHHRFNEGKRDPDVETTDMIARLGYPSETHTVESEDGYILTMHRIPYSKDSTSKSSYRSNPVFIQHGLLGSSVDFFLISSGDALPFLLSDLGFDVWLGNVRGNTYARRHRRLLPTSNEFWNYTWHESAVYDLPAMVDYVLDVTRANKIAYIGYSVGTTMFFAMASTKPEAAQKIEVALLMGPVAYSSNMKSPLLRFLAPLSKSGPMLSNLIASGEFLTTHYVLQLFTRYFCALPVFDEVFCRKYIFLIFGADYTHYNPTTTVLLLNHFPAGYSAKAMNHYAQLIKSGKFQQYDYGTRLNFRAYGSAYPPDYDLTRIDIPTYLYASKNDYLAPLEDVNHTAKFLPSLRKLSIVETQAFSHLDFLAGLDVRNLVYRPLLKHMLEELGED